MAICKKLLSILLVEHVSVAILNPTPETAGVTRPINSSWQPAANVSTLEYTRKPVGPQAAVGIQGVRHVFGFQAKHNEGLTGFRGRRISEPVRAVPSPAELNGTLLAHNSTSLWHGDLGGLLSALLLEEEVSNNWCICLFGKASIHGHTVYCMVGTVVLTFIWFGVAYWMHPGLVGISKPFAGFTGTLREFGVPATLGDPFATGPGPVRQPHLDNAKFLLMLTVLLTHCHVATKPWRWNKEAHFFINPCCTRTFGFISGIMTQDPPGVGAMRVTLFRMVAPLILFSAVVEPALLPLAEGEAMGGFQGYAHRVMSNLTEATAGATWYLFALVAWRIWGWMLMPLTPTYRMLAALIFASVGGYKEIVAFKLDQAIPSFPAFVFGQLFPYRLAVARIPATWSTQMLGFALLSFVWIIGSFEFGCRWLQDLPFWGWGDDGHPFLRQQAACGSWEMFLFWFRGLFRNMWEVTKGFIFIFLVCPRQRMGFLSDMGAHTLYPFLLHYSFAVLQNRFLELPADHVHWGAGRWLVCWVMELTFCLVVVTFLSSYPVRYIFAVLLEPRWLERLLAVADVKDSRYQRKASHAPGVVDEGQKLGVPMPSQAGPAQSPSPPDSTVEKQLQQPPQVPHLNGSAVVVRDALGRSRRWKLVQRS